MILQNPDGSETYYLELGDRSAETLVLLHGIGADHEMWQAQRQPYVDAGFHLLILDLFGHGQSSPLPSGQLFHWHNQISWLLAHRAVKTCTLIGVSMGGVIAQSFVVAYPQMVNNLVLADTFGELRTLREKLLGSAQLIGFHLFKRLGQQRLANSISQTYRADYAHLAQAYFSQVCLTANMDQLILARQAINQIDVLECLSEVTIPTLVMVGADLGQFFIEINQKIAQALPNAEFVVLQQSMDPSNLVNPDRFNHQVLTFLGFSAK
ncbi:alpha/beta hydrolase [Leptolyngbya cf. ectocarpi LEGE 11479]|uniref:Alpha/beta hydrolase n=1 Tax=Leptolyngbya cf. ectocarpi LEGE 11479 TaxID=1828722 RepID=A0A928ZV28_LEPEC|nr:alpha/beta hydrolase [Leptolyngbya ectocarpi]MBE9068005.1 alpha/beta hydrolase [Leptolyngbya cf. ectocarpi LEGE 11479]